MITRFIQEKILELLEEFPAVAILGPRQVGKTTLAENVSDLLKADTVYLDLETPSDLNKLQDAERYFALQQGKLIILDEIQRVPELFQVLRGVIDRRRKADLRSKQFLILGSASLDLLKQSSESLAGRIAYIDLTGFTLLEIQQQFPDIDRLWLRGGFPDSFLANSDEASFRWRTNFISTYLERDVPQFGSRIPAATLRLLWTMLAHSQGGQLNASGLAASLGVATTSAKRYVELLEDLLLIRTLRPWSGNIGKRLVKAPKVYIRDSGITHALLNLTDLNSVLGHPVAGGSWEGFVIENILACLPTGASAWFYRTAAGAEIDLVLEHKQDRYAIEIKRSLSPVPSKGFYMGCEDIKATHRLIVYPGTDTYPAAHEITVLPLLEMMQRLQKLS